MHQEMLVNQDAWKNHTERIILFLYAVKRDRLLVRDVALAIAKSVYNEPLNLTGVTFEDKWGFKFTLVKKKSKTNDLGPFGKATRKNQQMKFFEICQKVWQTRKIVCIFGRMVYRCTTHVKSV